MKASVVELTQNPPHGQKRSQDKAFAILTEHDEKLLRDWAQECRDENRAEALLRIIDDLKEGPVLEQRASDLFSKSENEK